MSKIKCLIIDLDDTIIDDTENHRGAFKHILEYLQITYQEELFQKWLEFDSYYWNEYFKSIKVPSKYLKSGETKSEYLRGMRFPLFFKRNLNPIAMQKEFKEGLRKNIVALPGVVETLRELAQDYPIYISTNGDSKVAKEKIRRIGAEEFIISIFSADMTNPPSNKSELDYYRQLIEYIDNVTYEECLMTGDKYRDDVIMPNKIGIKTCWVHKEVEDNGICDYRIDSLKELPEILKKDLVDKNILR